MKKDNLYLTADKIYRYLLGVDDELDTMIICKSTYVNLFTTDQSLYEAIGSIEDRQAINYNKLVKLLEVIEIKPFRTTMKAPRKILKKGRVIQIRTEASKRRMEQ